MTTDRTENDSLIEELRNVNRITSLDDSGIYYDTVTGQVVDIRGKLVDSLGSEHPRRVQGSYKVADVDSFIEYVEKHALAETELWGSRAAHQVVAVLNAHGAAGTHAGWEDHRAVLTLEVDPDWRDFLNANGHMHQQRAFSEFVEDHLHVFVKPTAADMLELAQTFQATTKVDFQSSQRVKSGETQLTYAETVHAGAGKKGTLAIPDEFTVGLSPYRGLDPYRVDARFRYRIEGQQLVLGYKLVRPDKVVDDAFDQITDRISKALNRPVWRN
jgi:uncharacterized protein YfdQ (DUF2303 family)